MNTCEYHAVSRFVSLPAYTIVLGAKIRSASLWTAWSLRRREAKFRPFIRSSCEFSFNRGVRSQSVRYDPLLNGTVSKAQALHPAKINSELKTCRINQSSASHIPIRSSGSPLGQQAIVAHKLISR